MSTQSTFKLDVRDDVIEFLHPGRFELEYVQQVAAAVTETRQRHPRLFVLCSAGKGATPEARKFITDWLKASPIPVEAAVWGGGVLHRAMAEMIIRGVQYFRPNQFSVTFHATRDDALAWIAEQRKSR
jgi:hypothetical protein